MRVNPEEPITGSLVAPVQRAWQSSSEWAGKLAALVGAGMQAVWTDFFLYALVLLLLSHAYDWIYGRQTARYHGRFDEDKSRIGLQSKVASLVLVLFVRFLEAGLVRFDHVDVDTGGLFAAAAALLLVVQDMRSIEAKRIRNEAGPIPFLSRGLDLVERAITGAMDRVLPRQDPED